MPTPTANVTENGVSKVSLTGTITAGNTYYIAVLPATLNSGFTIRFVTTDAIYNKSTSKALALARNNVVNLGSFATSGLSAIKKTGTAEATIGGGTVNVPWVQLWENGPKWALFNIGVTDGKAESCGEKTVWANDIVTTAWGSNWRMPTSDEFEVDNGDYQYYEGLLYECTCTCVNNYNGTGVKGLLCTGKGDYASNSIFLPTNNSSDAYWSSTHFSGQTYWTLYFSIGDNNAYICGINSGTSVYTRAVLNE